MHFTFGNVNEAFHTLVGYFQDPSTGPSDLDIARSTSRNGDVLYIQEPVIVTYAHPRERVLFNQARDCNPFFHLYEALWMLAGRNDVSPLAYYNSNIANYSDDGETFNGAYGYRWRNCQIPEVYSYKDEDGFGMGGMVAGVTTKFVDQLRILIDHLKAVPDSRRAVLQMWNVEDDLLKIGPQNQSKDVCCNTHVYFALRGYDVPHETDGDYDHKYVLDMTVCNRSNDLIWGLLGANAVHFSFLQEYMAACIGVEVGVYSQITNNCHVYLNDKWQPEKWLNCEDDLDYHTAEFCEHVGKSNWHKSNWQPFPLVKDQATFNREVVEFVERHSKLSDDPISYEEPFLDGVARWMCLAFHWHKRRNYEVAMDAISHVRADDWRIAATNWLQKRERKYLNRQ